MKKLEFGSFIISASVVILDESKAADGPELKK